MISEDLKAAGGVLVLILNGFVGMHASTKMHRSFWTWFFLSFLVSPFISFPYLLFLGPQPKDEPPPKTADPELVPFYDVGTRKVIRIPRKELAPGCMLVRIQGIGVDEPVWAAGVQYQPGPLLHPPFDEDVRKYIRQIQSAFAEHRPISVEEWEDGFRRDRNPTQEIALWMHAATIFTAFAGKESDATRRRHLYQVMIGCLTASPDAVKQVLPPGPLKDGEIDEVVRRFFPPRPTEG
jgi:hypothetical protein